MRPSLEERIQAHLHKLSAHFNDTVTLVEQTVTVPKTEATAYLRSNGVYGYVVESDPNDVEIEIYFDGHPLNVIWGRTNENAALYDKTMSLINEVKRRVGG